MNQDWALGNPRKNKMRQSKPSRGAVSLFWIHLHTIQIPSQEFTVLLL